MEMRNTMRKTKRFLLNTCILTGSTLLLQLIAVFFNAYLSRKIGSSGVGLYQLILSVYSFAVTLASSGIKLATTRLIVEADTKHPPESAKAVMKRCLGYACCFGLLAGTALFCGAEFISEHWLRDARTLLSLRILACSLPFLAMSSSLCGYFTAVRKVSRFAGTQMAEQLLRITVTVGILTVLLPKGLAWACAAVAIGACCGELLSFIGLFCLYRMELLRAKNQASVRPEKPLRRLLSIAIPDAVSSYARSALVTIEHLLIPTGLKKAGATNEGALAAYGVVQGMVLPVIMFPSALFNAMANLLIPEIAEYYENKQFQKIDTVVTKVLRTTFLFSIGVTGVLFCFSDELGMAIYHNEAASHYIRMLAPVVPVMYADTAVDGVLKGMGQQVSSMRYNIIDASVSVALVYVLLPRFAIEGYIITIFVTEILNFYLSVGKLVSITSFHLNVLDAVCKPLFCITGCVAVMQLILRIGLASAPMGLLAVLGIGGSLVLYAMVLRIFVPEGTKDLIRLVKA